MARSITSREVIEQLYDLFLLRGVPKYIRSDNGSEFTARAIRKWLAELKVTTLYIEPGSPWENRNLESFNGKLRDELLAREVFDTLLEARVPAARWRRHYNAVRPDSALGNLAPDDFARESAVTTAVLSSDRELASLTT